MSSITLSEIIMLINEVKKLIANVTNHFNNKQLYLRYAGGRGLQILSATPLMKVKTDSGFSTLLFQ